METRSLRFAETGCDQVVRVRFNCKTISVKHYRIYPDRRLWYPVAVKDRVKLYEELSYFDGVSIETGRMKHLESYLKRATASYPLRIRKHIVRKSLRLKEVELEGVVEFLHGNPLGVQKVVDMCAPLLVEQVKQLRAWVNGTRRYPLTFAGGSSRLCKELQHLGRG